MALTQQQIIDLFRLHAPALGISAPGLSPNQMAIAAVDKVVKLLNDGLRPDDPNYIKYDPAKGYEPSIGMALRARVRAKLAETTQIAGGLTSVNNFQTFKSWSPEKQKQALIDVDTEKDAQGNVVKDGNGNPKRRGVIPQAFIDDPSKYIALMEQTPQLVEALDTTYNNFKRDGLAFSVATTQALVHEQSGGTAPPAPATDGGTPPPDASKPDAAAVENATKILEGVLGQVYAKRANIPGMENMLNPGTPNGTLEAQEVQGAQMLILNVKKYLYSQGKWSGPVNATYNKQIGQLMQAGLNDEQTRRDLEKMIGPEAMAQLPSLFGALDTLSEADGDLLQQQAAAELTVPEEELGQIRQGQQIRGMFSRMPPQAKQMIGNIIQSLGPFGQILAMLLQAFMPGLDLSEFLGDEFKFKPGEMPSVEQFQKSYVDAANDSSIKDLPPEEKAVKIKERLLDAVTGVEGLLLKGAIGPERQQALKEIITESCDRAAEAAKKTPPEDPALVFAQTMRTRIEERRLLDDPRAQAETSTTVDIPRPQGDFDPGSSRSLGDATVTANTYFNGLELMSPENLAAFQKNTKYDASGLYEGLFRSGRIESGDFLVMGVDAATRQKLHMPGDAILITRFNAGKMETRVVDPSTIPGGVNGLAKALGVEPSAIKVAKATDSENCWAVSDFNGNGSVQAKPKADGGYECLSSESGGSVADRPHIRRRTRGSDNDYRTGYRDGYEDGSLRGPFRRAHGPIVQRSYGPGFGPDGFPLMRRDFGMAGGYYGRRSYDFRDNFPGMYRQGGSDFSLGLGVQTRGFGLRLGIFG